MTHPLYSKPIAKPVTTLLNNALRKAKLEQRIVRASGYYYVTGVACSSSMYVYRLEQNQFDLDHARTHVNAVLAEEGLHFHINEKLECVAHPVGYTGHLRACAHQSRPLPTLEQWQQSIAKSK